jgi:hypothetical protein
MAASTDHPCAPVGNRTDVEESTMAGETFVFIVDGMARRSARGPGDVDPPMPQIGRAHV